MNTAHLANDTDIALSIAPIVCAIIIVGAIVWWFIACYPKEKEKHLQKQEKLEEECQQAPEYAFIQAKVLLKKKGGYYQSELRMPALPNWIDEQSIVFLTEKGEEVEYPVRLEVFKRIEEGQEGTLVTVNGNFFDFGEGEDVSDEDVSQKDIADEVAADNSEEEEEVIKEAEETVIDEDVMEEEDTILVEDVS
jgi:hypothetical protein